MCALIYCSHTLYLHLNELRSPHELDAIAECVSLRFHELHLHGHSALHWFA